MTIPLMPQAITEAFPKVPPEFFVFMLTVDAGGGWNGAELTEMLAAGWLITKVVWPPLPAVYDGKIWIANLLLAR